MNLYRLLPFLYITSYVTMLILMRSIALDYGVKALTRLVVSFVCLLPWFIMNYEKLRTKYTILYLGRAIIASITILLTYKVYDKLPLPNATSISLSEPLFSSLFAFIFLREAPSLKKWSLLIIGYIGVLISLLPLNFGNQYLYFQFLLLLANILAASSVIIFKKISKEEKMVTILFYSHIYTIGLLTLINIFKQTSFSCELFLQFTNLKFLLAAGILGAVNNLIMVIAIRRLPISTFASAQYFRIVLVTLISVFAGEKLILKQIIGGLIILLSSLYL
ncbi:MAG: EamA family transporter [Alphaproteobacteria bacterium]|nr:MAG: EamA family transporter [Alphaproteobacteria bacterium]